MSVARPMVPLLVLVTLLAAPRASRGQEAPAAPSLGLAPAPAGRKHDLSKEKVLYCVGYAHLDTQWRWDYTTTIDEYVKATLDDNFALFEKHPGYVFNFTGSARYAMMKEYYPERWETLKQHVAAGRWHVSGSSVDEGDVNVPSAEAVLRQVLYGNAFFRREFGKESIDFMLPDCFGFPASMPSIWAHAGLRGFSTQKLTWGSAVGIPFKIGRWIGPDGRSVLAALDPGSYADGLTGRVDLHPGWTERIERNGRDHGVFADYHYYGVGDIGGAPREEHVAAYLGSIGHPDSRFIVDLASSDQMFRDITDEQAARLPSYQGDMLLTEHSAGTLTSQSYMKRWNRKGEILADGAERAAVAAAWVNRARYPREALTGAWERLLANQMHDILPGTSIPRAYTFSWNDEIVAQNVFASVLTDSTGAVASLLDTEADGVPLVVHNALAIEREDPVEAEVAFGSRAPRAVRVFDGSGNEVPSQVLGRTDRSVRVLFLARVPPNSFTVFDARPARTAWTAPESAPLSVTERGLESPDYRVTLDANGDVASIVDKRHGNRELLREPARLVFTREKPRSWPAWNMDWADRQRPPAGHVDGPATVRIAESGPVRVALEVTRNARNSTVTQRIRLTRGDAGRRVEFDTDIDWQSAEVALRAAFPLTISNPKATYDWGMGTIERGNNEPVKYEVPSHEWFDLTDVSGAYGVTILEDSKFGSDKPGDATLRLTLLYSPGVRKQYQDQHSQDWGRHEILYGLAGHAGDWRDGRSSWQGRRLNVPLRAFQVDEHEGSLGRSHVLASVSTPQVDIRALKQSEEGGAFIVRLQELWGRATGEVEIAMARPIAEAWEVDGQERLIGDAIVRDGKLVVSMSPHSPRSFAVRPDWSAPMLLVQRPVSTPLSLPFDADVVSSDAARGDGAMDSGGRTYPAEMLPARVEHGDVEFRLGPVADGAKNAVTCTGQSLRLPEDAPSRVHFLLAATEDVQATFRAGAIETTVSVPSWTGFVGQWDDRLWDREFAKVDHETAGRVVGFRPGYIKSGEIAWFATHRHHPARGNESYRFSYLWEAAIDVPEGAREIVLPNDPRIRILAATAVGSGHDTARAATPLLDDFSDRFPIAMRHQYPAPPRPVFEGLEHAGIVAISRAESFEALTIGPPSREDSIDASTGRGLLFRFHERDGDGAPHWRSGADGNALPRLNDGVVAGSDDDTSHCVWWDQEGRFSIDLGASRLVHAVRTYSWHRAERAPQWFSLWGSNSGEPPPADFKAGSSGDWTLLAVVDTRELGQGGMHGSSVVIDRAMRHLLWVAEDVGNGTFFTEIDVDAEE